MQAFVSQAHATAAVKGYSSFWQDIEIKGGKWPGRSILSSIQFACDIQKVSESE